MHPKDYLYVVRVSGGWAACCQRCGATITITRTRHAAYWHGADHTCATTSKAVAR